MKITNFNEEAYNFNVNAAQVAEERGLIPVYPEPNQLQLDIDSDEQYEEFTKRLHLLDFANRKSIKIEMRPSQSGLPKRHITLTFANRTFTPIERIAYQFALNSDPIREMLSVHRVEEGTQEPSCIFEVPDSKAEILTF